MRGDLKRTVYEKVCAYCGKPFTVESNIESPATEEHDGTEFRVCSVCQFRETKSFSNVTYTSPRMVSSPDSQNSQSRNLTEEDQTSSSNITEGTSNPEKNPASVTQTHHVSWLIIAIIITLVCLGLGVLIYMIVRKKEKNR